jgi:hypothetical protein
MKCRLCVCALPPIRNGASPSLKDAFDEGVVVVLNVGRLVRRADAHDGAHIVDQVCSGDDRGAAEGVPDQ